MKEKYNWTENLKIVLLSIFVYYIYYFFYIKVHILHISVINYVEYVSLYIFFFFFYSRRPLLINTWTVFPLKNQLLTKEITKKNYRYKKHVFNAINLKSEITINWTKQIDSQNIRTCTNVRTHDNKKRLNSIKNQLNY